MSSIHLTITILVLLTEISSSSSFPCLNGATYDPVYDRCECTPSYYGYRCETAFALNDPCKNADHLPIIDDLDGNYRPGATNVTLFFSTIQPQWYRVLSPWGDRLVEGCSSGVNDSDCGGRAAYILHDVRLEEAKPQIRELLKARAFRVWRQQKSCRLEDETFYPVRILKCSQSVALYFLLPLPRTHSYCIGNERDPARSSIIPRKPILQLFYNSDGHGDFNCSVFVYNIKGVKYTVKFVLRTRHGRPKIIKECSKNCKENCTVTCPWYSIGEQNENIYGSSLECSVKPEVRNAPEISSNAHSLKFNYKFNNGEAKIRPGELTEFCISTRSIPLPPRAKISFAISVSRKIKYRKDRLDIAVLSNDKNRTRNVCEVETSASTDRKKRQVCMKIILYNKDREGKFVYGLEEAELQSMAKINVSFKSSADGLHTHRNSKDKYYQFLSLDLNVDLRKLNSGPQSYLHIFSDPFVKPVGGIYKDGSTYNLKAKRGDRDIYVAMRHKKLPYEVQISITTPPSADENSADASVVTRVAIRYDYNLIFVSGNSSENNGDLMTRYTCKAPNAASNLANNDQIGSESGCKSENGIKVQKSADVVRIEFKFYGTIIYIWKFRTSMEVNSSCAHRFIMSRREINSVACRGATHPVGDAKEFALDLTVIPSMYDTNGNVDGLMYAKNLSEAAMHKVSNPIENLFSDKYVARRPKQNDHNFIDQPFQIVNICKCDGTKKMDASQGCFVNITRIERTKREAPVETPVNEGEILKPGPVTKAVDKASPFSSKNQISLAEAQQFCSEFLSVQMLEKNYSLSLCSGHSDHQIGADYATQFEFLCTRYALTLGTYQFAETLLNSMLDSCRKDISYNASEIRANSRVLQDLVSEICPNKCGNGTCLAGSCSCKPGYSGRGCENRIEELELSPTRISISNQNYVCTSGNCSHILLLVSPMLKSHVADCLIRHRVFTKTFDKSYGRFWKVAAVYATGSVMICNVSEIHNWLTAENRLYAVVEISLESATCRSNNSIERLLVQSECYGRQTHCRFVEREKWATDQLTTLSGWTCQSSNVSTEDPAASCHREYHATEQLQPRHRAMIIFVCFVTLLLVNAWLGGFCLVRKFLTKKNNKLAFKLRQIAGKMPLKKHGLKLIDRKEDEILL